VRLLKKEGGYRQTTLARSLREPSALIGLGADTKVKEGNEEEFALCDFARGQTVIVFR